MASAGHNAEERQPLQAGRVGRAHGLDGSFYVTGAQTRLLALGMTLTIAGVPRAIVRRAGIDKRPIVRLEGIEDRTSVEELRGTPLMVPREDAPTLPAGEWWAHEPARLSECSARTVASCWFRWSQTPSGRWTSLKGASTSISSFWAR